ncbi:allophanate hydrolase [Pseudomaricurvus sp. HS19]|uniref:allophanate hydrolase n=1 Tax=Pseudomaricurvus sp. HS19 TaxID=2692626 RepID=UPI00136F0EC1|nr:allophanate hydrolase [Pseudomaricurvus sp. HS19]MYM63209.1 allophanate hydrolase [Pseudomaricurvus sp. HS19]
MTQISRNMTVSALRGAYLDGSLTPAELFAEIRTRAAEYEDRNIWIHLLTEEEQAPLLATLADKDPATSPLWGIPFAIKDNIDLAGIPTTAACKEFAYTPESSATVVQQLIDAGAIPVGKTNLDQFATGLNGTRSPWGPCKNSFNPEYVSGGSSAGSSVSVALGLVSFSLGTDTAGSGRVPACFNNLVGVKPSIGLLSASGMLPACRSLDCITIFALDTDDANDVLAVAEGYDSTDAYSRKNPFNNAARHYGERGGNLRVGVIPPAQLQFFGDEAYENAYNKTLQELAAQGFEFVEIDYAPFEEAARLLYEGPWVAERYLAAQPLVDDNPDAIFPVVRQIIEPGSKPKATDLFKAQYRLRALKAVCDETMASVDCLLTPTVGRCFTIEEMLAEPILRNSQFGLYTNFMNLLDYSAVAVPTQMATNGLPFGITLAGQVFKDRELLSIARRVHRQAGLTLGASEMPVEYADSAVTAATASIDVVVCGAHLDGLPLNWQLRERGAVLKSKTHTAPCYRMYALAGGPPYRPGLVCDEKGSSIEVEVWSVPAAEFGSFVAGIPAPLGIGKVRLADDSLVTGFICEPYGIEGAQEITHLGGWRSYLASK